MRTKAGRVKAGDGTVDTDDGVNELYNRARPQIHGESSNMAMVDAHVERIRFEDFLDPCTDFWHDDPDKIAALCSP